VFARMAAGIDCSEGEALDGFRAIFPKRVPVSEEEETTDLSAFPISLGDLMKLYEYFCSNSRKVDGSHDNLVTADQEQVL